MAGIYINDTILDFRNNHDNALATTQTLRNFNVNSKESFVFYLAEDGNRLFPVPCYKTNRVTANGDRVYYPAMSLSEAKAFKSLRNKVFYTSEDKRVLARASEALDKCAESYGLDTGSLSIKRLSDYYEYFERSSEQEIYNQFRGIKAST